jgi:hypothetical protein
VLRATSIVPAAPTPVDPQALAQRWARLEAKALDVVEVGVDGAFDDPDHYRAQLAAADRVLGFRKGGLPPPAIGGALREVTAEKRIIRLTWGDGRLVNMPLYRPDQIDDQDDDDA